MKKLVIAIAVLSFAFLGTTFAAVENVKVSGDVNVEGIARDLGFGNTSDNSDQYVLSQIRLRIDADLTEGVSAVVRMLNERIWGEDDMYSDDSSFTLDLGYVELKEFLYSPLTLVVGRQNLRFGNGLIIGDPDTNRYSSLDSAIYFSDLSMRKSFDAVRGVLDFAPWTIDLVYAKVDENDLNINDDVTLLGVNAAYDWSSYNGITEVYFFSMDRTFDYDNPAASTVEAGYTDSNNKVYVLGSRAQADLNDNFTLGLEGAWQFGDYRDSDTAHDHLNAYAVQLMSEYRLLDSKNTKLGLNYTYLSGDDNKGSDDAYNGWNPMFEDQSPGEVINILLDNTNMQYWQASVSTMPREDVTLGLKYIYARMVQDNTLEKLEDIYTSSADFGSIDLKKGEKEIGHEIDLCGVYDYTEDVQLKISGGWLIPGNVFDNSNDNVGYSIRGGMTVSF